MAKPGDINFEEGGGRSDYNKFMDELMEDAMKVMDENFIGKKRHPLGDPSAGMGSGHKQAYFGSNLDGILGGLMNNNGSQLDIEGLMRAMGMVGGAAESTEESQRRVLDQFGRMMPTEEEQRAYGNRTQNSPTGQDAIRRSTAYLETLEVGESQEECWARQDLPWTYADVVEMAHKICIERMKNPNSDPGRLDPRWLADILVFFVAVVNRQVDITNDETF